MKVSIVPYGVFYRFGITHMVKVKETRLSTTYTIGRGPLTLLLTVLSRNPSPLTRHTFKSLKTMTYRVRNILWLNRRYLQVRLVIEKNPRVKVSLTKFKMIPTAATYDFDCGV